jgi:WD40 repeat protein/tRNA A-37 threonylcarbamoyl transferase component Bud32
MLEGRLEPATDEQVSQHVDGCATCQQWLEECTDTSSLSHSLQAPVVAPLRPYLQQIRETPVPRLVQSTTLSSPREPLVGPLPAAILPTLEGYETLRELGRGGVGVVYLARQQSLNRLVALKVLRSGPFANAEERSRFRQEAATVARLRHAHIVHVYEIGEQEGAPFLAMEYVEGGSLRDHLQGNPQPLLASVGLLETIARTIQQAHDAGLIHRDLKPANILLQPRPVGPTAKRELGDYEPKLTDFGLAKELDDPTVRTATGEIVGTPSYMAPEQAASRRGELGPATDLYALGAILYEMLTGRPPFKGATAVDTVMQVLHQEVVRPSSLRPELPRDLETICLTCLNKDPARRYPSATALADDLARFRKGQPIQARPIGPLERAAKWTRAHPLPAALLGGIVAITLLGFAGITWQWREAIKAGNRYLEERVQKEAERELAEKARTEAATQRREARQALYGSRIAQSQLYWRVSDLTGARRVLESCLPHHGEEDRRGWEWYHLRRLYRSETLILDHSIEGSTGAVVHSPTGDQLVSLLASADPEGESELVLWKPLQQQPVWRRSLPGAFHRVCFHPTESRIALGGLDGQVLIEDLAPSQQVRKWKAHEAEVFVVQFSADGQLLLTAGADQLVQLWSARDGKWVRTLRGHAGTVQAACFVPGTPWIASAGWDQTVRLWNRTGTAIRTLEGHQSPVLALACSPEGKFLASGAQDGSVKIWDLANGRVVQNFTAVTGAILQLTFSPDGRTLIYTSVDCGIHLWDVELGAHKANYRGHSAAILGLSVHPSGETLVSCCPREGALAVWDLTRMPEATRFAQANSSILAVAFGPNDQEILSLSQNGLLQGWSRKTGVPTIEHTLLDGSLGPTQMTSACFSRQGERAAAGVTEDGRIVRVWQTQTGQLLHETLLPGRVTCLAFNPSAHVLGVGVAQEKRSFLYFLQADTGKLVYLQEVATPPEVLVFRDDHVLAWGGRRGRLGLVDLHARQASVARMHRGTVQALAFHPTQPLLVSASESDRQIRLSRFQSRPNEAPQLEEAWALESLGVPSRLCFSPDGKRLAAISQDVIKIWDPQSRLEMLTLRGLLRPFWEEPESLVVQFSHDGLSLVASNWDDSLSLWEAESPRTESPAESIPEAFFSPERAAYWHLTEAEHALQNGNLRATEFHLRRMAQFKSIPRSLEPRREFLEERWKRSKPGRPTK